MIISLFNGDEPYIFLGSEQFGEVIETLLGRFFDMAGYLLENKLFLIGLVIFVIGATIGLVKRVIS